MEERFIHISTKTLLKILGIGLLCYILFLIWDIVLLIFVSLIFAALIEPFARSFERRKIPRGLAVFVVYILFFAVLGFVLSTLVPVIARDVPPLVESAVSAISDLERSPVFGQLLRDVEFRAQQIPTGPEVLFSEGGPLAGVFSTISGFFGGLFSFVLVLVITFYMVVQDDPIKKILRSVLPDEYIPYVWQVIRKIREKLSAWVRGQLLLSVIVGLMVYIGLTLLQVEYAAVIALLAALFEFVPYIGPILAAIPGLFFGFQQGGHVTAILVLALYVIIQQVENHILVPKIMQHAVGLNPVVSIIAVLVGADLAGVIGALIAIPVATAGAVIIREMLGKRMEAKNKQDL